MTGISRSKMESLALSCDDVEDGITGLGAKVTGEDNRFALAGWQFEAAVRDVKTHWKDKADNSGRQWKYYASAVRATACDMTATDKEVAFTLPELGEGETAIPLPTPFSLFGK